ncbi:MAG: hypothetical protein P4L43_07875 [Syntrophobacteraceae bacterium]|nr:hypothetical protein [Syntrophobacteraceae bacterium]
MLSFIQQLRKAEIPVSVRYILEFYDGILKGLAPDLDRLFILARLVFVKKVEHYDAFERVFAAFFLGKDSWQMPDWENAFAGKPFEEWLREQVERGAITPDELRTFDIEELLKKFWKTLLKQDGAHHGGSRWVGTGGRSPFGHSGSAGGGVRVYGRGLHGTAQKVIDQRNYMNYSGKSPLAGNNVSQVLACLKNLQRAGPESELEIDETIHRTAKNGGEIELVFAREFRDRLKLVVLLDNGGYSMEPHLQLVKSVFSKIRDKFKDLKYYYFHNCLYGTVYEDMERMKAVGWETLVSRGADTHLIVIGDANMAPSELMAANGALYFYTADRRPGVEWLKQLRAAFPASVWLNPIPRQYWSSESATIGHIGRIFPMEDLTLAGIRNAVQILGRGRD